MRISGRRIVAILLTVLVLPAGAGALAGSPSVEPPAGDLATVFRFEDPREPQRGGDALRNGDFSGGLEHWTVDDGEIGDAAEFSAGPSGLRIEVAAAARAGTVFARQSVPIEFPAYVLSVATAASGQPPRYAFLVRESGFPEGRHATPYLDSLYEFVADASEAEYRFEWRAKDADSTRADVYLRISMGIGDSAAVSFPEASFAPTTSHAWDFGDGSPVVFGRVVDHRFVRPGVFNVTLERRDLGGAPESSTVRVEVANRAPEIVVSAGRVAKTGRFVVDATGSCDPDARPVAVRNPSFSAGLAGWDTRSEEIGGRAGFDGGNGTLRIAVGGASSAGSVFASQVVPLSTDRPHRFSVRARDDGGIAAYWLILRETGSALGDADHEFVYPPTGGDWQTFVETFAPSRRDSTAVIVHLRALLNAGDVATVEFDDVELREGLRYSWSLDGTPRGVPGPRLEIHPAGGPRAVTLNAVDPFGAVASRTVWFDASNPEDAAPHAAIAPAPLGVLGALKPLHAAPSRPHPMADALDNAAFASSRGWFRFLPPGGAVSFDHGRATLLVPAGATSPADLGQRVPLRTHAHHEIHGRIRAVGEVARIEIVVREHHGASLLRSAGGTQDQVFEIPADAGWRDFRQLWRPSSWDATHATVFLRVHAAAGVEGRVELEAPSFAAAKSYVWRSGAGPATPGFSHQPSPASAGNLTVALDVRDTFGRAASTSVRMRILDPAAFQAERLLTGDVRLGYSGAGDLVGAVLEVTRTAPGTPERRLLLPGGGGAVLDPSPHPEAAYAAVLVIGDGSRVPLATATPGGPGSLGAVSVPGQARRAASLEIHAKAPSDARRVEGTLAWGPLILDRFDFAQDPKEPQAWSAAPRLGRILPPTLRLEVVAESGNGETASLGGGPASISVPFAGGEPLGLLLLVGLPTLPGAAFAIRRARRRPPRSFT